MERKYRKQTGSFLAHDSNGVEYTLHVFTEFFESHESGAQTVVEGLKSLVTSNGQHVNRLDKGKYRTVGIREVDLVSDDPDAV